MSLASQVEAVRGTIAAACDRSGRDSASITLIAVSKTHPADLVDQVLEAGVADIGENRVQEARDKFSSLRGAARKHLIGSLQSNKARLAVQLFDVIHSLDSEKLALELERHASVANRRLPVLIQVNVGREEQKGGVAPEAARSLAKVALGLPHLELLGLMTIPPAGTAEETRPFFAALRELRDNLRGELGPGSLPELSMGMTQDYDVAIEEGATMVRVGRAIFGERQGR